MSVSKRVSPLTPLAALRQVVSLWAAADPQVVVLALGGNDLDSASDHALLVGVRLFELAKSLVSRTGCCGAGASPPSFPPRFL